MAENKTALIVVDVQKDFMEGGSLPVEGGSDVAVRIEQYIAADENKGEGRVYDEIVFTADWHVPGANNGGHMSETPDYVDTWPFHCVQGTEGAEIAEVLKGRTPGRIIFRKGMGEPAYSGFQGWAEDIGMDEFLRGRGITVVHVVGLAADYCVKATAEDAVANGYVTTVLAPLTAGINTDPATVAAHIAELQTSTEV